MILSLDSKGSITSYLGGGENLPSYQRVGECSASHLSVGELIVILG